ncbi:MAG: hypothetical protein ABGZ17_25990, partial [Planctomycetaceae bacterium]
LCGRRDEERSRLTWTDLGGHEPGALQQLLLKISGAVALFSILGFAVYRGLMVPGLAGTVAAGVTLVLCLTGIRSHRADGLAIAHWWSNDRIWASVLCALAVFMHFYFY